MVAARRRGVDISGHRGQVVRREDFQEYDYILPMDRDNLARLKKLQPASGRAELKLLLGYAAGVPQDEVPDPYYGGAKDFEQVLDLVEAGGKGLLAEIMRRQGTRR
jgi:protein-tyrosine phosphatase